MADAGRVPSRLNSPPIAWSAAQNVASGRRTTHDEWCVERHGEAGKCLNVYLPGRSATPPLCGHEVVRRGQDGWTCQDCSQEFVTAPARTATSASRD